jgi:RNA polymerase-binding transcription factor DksA
MACGVLLHFDMATSADILGFTTRSKIPVRWARHHERLCAERDRLLQRDDSPTEVFQPKLDDLADAASQESQRSLSMVAATAAHGTMVEVLEAIRRIERGTYGTCEITGEPISAERLTTIPWTRYSLEGQQQVEQSGFARRTGLPSLEGLGTTESESAESDEDSD